MNPLSSLLDIFSIVMIACLTIPFLVSSFCAKLKQMSIPPFSTIAGILAALTPSNPNSWIITCDVVGQLNG